MKQMRSSKAGKRFAVILIACVVLLLGCGSSKTASDSAYAGSYYNDVTASAAKSDYNEMAYPAEEMEMAGGSYDYYEEDVAEPAGNNYREDAVQQKLIQNIYHTVRVDDPAKSSDDILTQVQQLGGYLLSSSNSYDAETNTGYAQMTVRIPTGSGNQMKAFLEEIGKIESSSTDAQDVTNEYYDLQIRIEQGKEELKQLNELLAKCETVEDILYVRNQISYVQSEVESMEGQFRRLSELTSYDTMYITLYPQKNMIEGGNDGGRFLTLKEFGNGFVKGLKTSVRVVVNGLGYILIFLATILLPVLVFGGIIYAIVRLIIMLAKKSRAKKKEKRARKLAKQQEAKMQQQLPPQQQK